MCTYKALIIIVQILCMLFYSYTCTLAQSVKLSLAIIVTQLQAQNGTVYQCIDLLHLQISKRSLSQTLLNAC